MKIESYCYTRGKQPDYRNFCVPSEVGENLVSILRNMVTPILGQNLDTPRWVLYKCHGVVVWGICCKNKLLSSSCNVDKEGRPVRGFFAFIYTEIDDSEFCLPAFDINLFKELYKKEVAPYWHCQAGDFHHSQIHSTITDAANKIYAKHNNEYFAKLNTNVFQCKSLGDGDRQEVVAAALSLPEVSLLIDNEDMSEATGRKEPFMNCLSSNISPGIVNVRRICPRCHKSVDAFTEEGICNECDTENNKKEDFNTVDPKDVEQKELLQLKKELLDCEFHIEEYGRALAREKRKNKFLWIICGIFFIAIAWLLRNPKNSRFIFGNKEEVTCDTNIETIEKQYQFEVFPKAIEVPANGKDSVNITWKTDLPRMKAKIDSVDWIKELSEDATSITVNVEKNGTNERREATVELVLGELKEIVVIKQAAQTK